MCIASEVQAMINTTSDLNQCHLRLLTMAMCVTYTCTRVSTTVRTVEQTKTIMIRMSSEPLLECVPLCKQGLHMDWCIYTYDKQRQGRCPSKIAETSHACSYAAVLNECSS